MERADWLFNWTTAPANYYSSFRPLYACIACTNFVSLCSLPLSLSPSQWFINRYVIRVYAYRKYFIHLKISTSSLLLKIGNETICRRRKESVESVDVSLPGSNTVHQSVIKDARRVCRSRYTGSKIIYYIIRDIFSVQDIIKCIKCNFLRV